MAAKKQKKRREAKTARRRKLVTKLPPEAPLARDEGPRLIPLSPIKVEHPRLARLIELADQALLGPDRHKKRSGGE